MRAFRAEAPALCLERAVEASKRQPVPLEMEDDVVAPQAAYELMTSFKDSQHGVGLRSNPSLGKQASGAPRSLGTRCLHFARLRRPVVKIPQDGGNIADNEADAFYIATHEAVSQNGRLAIVPADTRKSDEYLSGWVPPLAV
jgi:hypothetical protein